MSNKKLKAPQLLIVLFFFTVPFLQSFAGDFSATICNEEISDKETVQFIKSIHSKQKQPYAFDDTDISCAIEFDKSLVVQYFLDFGMDPNQGILNLKLNPLLLAVENRSFTTAITLLNHKNIHCDPSTYEENRLIHETIDGINFINFQINSEKNKSVPSLKSSHYDVSLKNLKKLNHLGIEFLSKLITTYPSFIHVPLRNGFLPLTYSILNDLEDSIVSLFLSGSHVDEILNKKNTLKLSAYDLLSQKSKETLLKMVKEKMEID